jgi:hypothetical protein
LEVVVAEVMKERREREAGTPLFTVLAAPIAESGDKS